VKRTPATGKDVKAVLKGVNYLVRHVQIHGLCDPPAVKNPEIVIDDRLRGKELLNTYIHETIHALKWNLTEDQVTQMADDLSQLLWDLGYRLKGK